MRKDIAVCYSMIVSLSPWPYHCFIFTFNGSACSHQSTDFGVLWQLLPSICNKCF